VTHAELKALVDDVRVGDVYRRHARVELADESTRQFEVLEIGEDPDMGLMAVTCRPGQVGADGFEHGGLGCCGWITKVIAGDVKSGALVKVRP
jgi:hypothetical protein